MSDKEQLLYEFEYGITVGQLIQKLERFPKDLVVVNDCKNKQPITDVDRTTVDYCFDEIITKEVVSIF